MMWLISVLLTLRSPVDHIYSDVDDEAPCRTPGDGLDQEDTSAPASTRLVMVTDL